MPQLAIRLLGPFQATIDSQPITSFAYDKVRALLAYLAVEADHFHRRETLATLFWPNHPPKLARQNLRQSLATLRRAIKDQNASPPFLLIDGDMVQFNYSSHTWLDVAAFRAHLEAGDHTHPDSEIETCQSCIQHLEKAVALYRGEFLAGLLLSDCSEFETWAVTCREYLHIQALTALYHITRYYLRRGQYRQAQTYALQQIGLAPCREEAHRQLMRILVCTGQRSAALAQYETCCRILAEEFGVEPSPQTQTLYKRIRSVGKGCPHNLPSQLTSLIGREGELQQLAEHLTNPDCRLLTLTGPGGIGKTRLALQAVTEQVGFFLDGVYFVPLAALSSATFLVSAIADALDLCFSGSQDPETELLDYLHEKELLLVLDNFEHLLSPPEGGIGEGVKLLLDILKHAPEVKVMVTSRTRLNLQAEWVFKVRELAFPEKTDAEGVETYSAVRLFVERARRVETGFLLSAAIIPAVVRICQLVKGMPLGIELAAAFVLALSCNQIAAEIERNLDVLATSMQDVPERHRSLRAVLRHSWGLLSAAEQAVIRKLAVFQGAFEPEAARAVAGATLSQLKALLDKSFLNRGQTGQYDLHPLLKQYAAEKLAADPQEQAETEARHGVYYADFMAAMLEKRKQAKQHQDIQAAVKAAIGNVVAALQWAAARREMATLNNIIYLLYLYYDASGQYETGKKVFDQALGMMEKYTNLSDEECLVLAKVLGFVSVYNLRLAAYHQARERLQQSLAIARQLKHQAQISFCLHALSEVALGLGDYAETRRLAEEALAVRRQTGGSPVTILNFLGKVALEQGKLTEAREYQAEALAIARANKQVISGNVAHPLEGLGWVAHRMGDPLAARKYLQESLEICRAIEHKWGIADCLGGLGRIATDLGHYQLAEQLFQESLAGYVDIGKSDEAALLMRNQGWLAECLADYEKAKRLYQKSYDESKKTQEKSKRLSALADLGRVTILLDEHQAAEQHLHQALAFFDTMGHQGGLAIALTGLGILERERGRYQEAQRHFQKALQAALREQEIYEALKTLAEWVTLLTEQGKNETVLEILAFLFRHPAITQYHRNRAEALAAKLPTEVVASARERGEKRSPGKNRSLTEIVAGVLDE